MRIVEIDAAAAAPCADVAVWLVWCGDVPLGALVRAEGTGRLCRWIRHASNVIRLP